MVPFWNAAWASRNDDRFTFCVTSLSGLCLEDLASQGPVGKEVDDSWVEKWQKSLKTTEIDPPFIPFWHLGPAPATRRGQSLYSIPHIKTPTRLYVCWDSVRKYFPEGQKYPFGKLFISSSRCYKTTRQTKWRILENPEKPSAAPRVGNSAARRIPPGAHVPAHLGPCVHIWVSENQARGGLWSHPETVAHPPSTGPGWTPVYPLDIEAGHCWPLQQAMGLLELLLSGAGTQRIANALSNSVRMRDLAAVTCWSPLNSPNHSQPKCGNKQVLRTMFLLNLPPAAQIEKLKENKWKIRAAGNLKYGKTLDCRANTKGPETEFTCKHKPQERIIPYVILETSVQYKRSVLITFHRLVLNSPSNVCVDL